MCTMLVHREYSYFFPLSAFFSFFSLKTFAELFIAFGLLLVIY